ncbi:MAG TPA: PqqD family peptide modification chaperone [bacterium]|nr:PqqD family peptide modification chaperone [bacterium]
MILNPKNDIVLREEDGDAFLFDPGTGRVSVINAAGVIIWKELNEGKNAAAIVKTLKTEYADVDEKTLQADCDTFLKNLVALGYAQTK